MSPHHRLNDDQKKIKDFIKERCTSVMGSYDPAKNEPQLIMIEGGTGTGKSVLTAITLFELIHDTRDCEYNIKLIINHDEQKKVFSDIIKNRGLGNDVVYKPATFIHKYNTLSNDFPGLKDPVDIVFIDEAHLINTSRTQGYERYYDSHQLKEIMKRSKVTVIMFDEFQALEKDQYLGADYIQYLRDKAKKGGNYKNPLIKQLRMNCSEEQLNWIDSITGVSKDYIRVPGTVLPIPKTGSEGYEIKIFDTPEKLYKAIKEKAQAKDDTLQKEKEKDGLNINAGLSRLIATYDWNYTDKLPEEHGKMWMVTIGSFSMPWNYQYEKYIIDTDKPTSLRSIDDIKDDRIRDRMNHIINNNSYEHMNKVWKLPWQEQEHTIDEVGSTYTIQGFDLEYAGVILGQSVRYDRQNRRISFDIEKKKEHHDETWNAMTGSRSDIGDVGTVLLENELRVLLTRGTKGLYIYAEDDDLREALLNAQAEL